jgi:hypothetical protein
MLVLAVVLGAVALYRYESTRTVSCGVEPTTTAVPVDANVTRWFARVYPANELRDGPPLHRSPRAPAPLEHPSHRHNSLID